MVSSGGAGDRVGDHAGLGPLDDVDLGGLVLDRQVAVQHADAALARHRDRHPRLGDGVHALDSSGVRKAIDLDSRVEVSTSLGMTSDAAGSSSTSSKVSPSVPNFAGRSPSLLPTRLHPHRQAKKSVYATDKDYGGHVRDDPPLDPFADDPSDPAAGLRRTTSTTSSRSRRRSARTSLADLEDLEVFQALLEPRGVRGLVVDCEDCEEPHYFAWDLLRGNLRHLLDEGLPRVHEPAFAPDPSDYVSWDYARGFADGVLTADEDD